MARRREDDLDCKVFVGGLDRDSEKEELEKAFGYYGPLESVWIAKNPPGFGFIIFKDRRDAEDAVHALDGTTLCGVRVRVEHSSGRIKRKPWQRGGSRAFDPDDKCYRCGNRGHYWYDCGRYGGDRERDRDRRRSYSPRRRSRSRSPPPRRSPSPRRSRSPRRRWSRSRSRSPRD